MEVLLGPPAKPDPPVLYVPEGTVPNEGEPVLLGEGSKTLGGSYISTRTWRFTNTTNGRTQLCCVLDDEMSDDAIEQAKGEAKENFLRDTNGLPRLITPTVERRKEIGRAIKDYREFKKLMAESTNSKVFY